MNSHPLSPGDRADIVSEIAKWLGYTVLTVGELAELASPPRHAMVYVPHPVFEDDNPFFAERSTGCRFTPFGETGWIIPPDPGSLSIHEVIQTHGEAYVQKWSLAVKAILEYRQGEGMKIDADLLLSPWWLYCEALVRVILDEEVVKLRAERSLAVDDPICPVCGKRVKPGEEGVIQDTEGRTLHRVCEEQKLHNPFDDRPETERERIIKLNDCARKAMGVASQVVLTVITAALSPEDRSKLFEAVERDDSFTKGNDLWGEHDFGAVEILLGQDPETGAVFSRPSLVKFFWKIDDYGASFREHGASHRRIITLMHPRDNVGGT